MRLTHTVWILGDQLSHHHPGLARHRPGDARVLMIESRARGSVLRYHQQKLVLIYSAMRHFAEELRGRGWQVDYYPLTAGHSFNSAWQDYAAAHQPGQLTVAEPHSFAETGAVAAVAARHGLVLTTLPGVQFLVGRAEFLDWAAGRRRLLMEQHYRRVRVSLNVLVDRDGEPTGGRWNFDVSNRQTYAAWKRQRGEAPTLERSTPDTITAGVIDMVAREFADHPGQAAGFWLPVDRSGATAWLQRFVRDRLPGFGAFEDMMASAEPVLFHSVLSPLINIGLLSPRECIDAAVRAHDAGAAPINSVEGFVRQILGWREFINGVYWVRGPEYRALNMLGAERPLPAWTYSGDTPMNCLHQVLDQTLRVGWNHHIQRLMILGNFFLLAGINPQQALRWFSEMYVDAYDWVMAPNVIGMSQHADGGYMATKPYAATSNYIRKMSDYCAGCRFDPDEKVGTRACPFNHLYWDFIDRHASRFSSNVRMRQTVAAWDGRPPGDKRAIRRSAAAFLDEHVGGGKAE